MTENFLEKLAAQWYDYKGYMTKRNLRFGIGEGGGTEGEMDVLAYNPLTKKAVHLEAATLGESYKDTGDSHKTKFNNAEKYYKDYIPVAPSLVKKKSLILSASKPQDQSVQNFEQNSPSEFIHISTFLDQMFNKLKKVETGKSIISERLNLLRLCHIITEYFDLTLKEKYQ